MNASAHTEGRHGTMATFKVQEFRDATADLVARVEHVQEAKAQANADLTPEQKAFQRARQLRSSARNLADTLDDMAKADALKALAESVDAWLSDAPEDMRAPEVNIDRSEGDDVAEDLAYMLRQVDKGKAPNVNDADASAARDALSAWADTRPRRGGARGSADNVGANTGKRFPGPVLLTIDGEKLAQEGSVGHGATLGSVGVAALRRWREDHGSDSRDSSAKAPAEWMGGRKSAFSAICDKNEQSAEWTDAEGHVYRVERV